MNCSIKLVNCIDPAPQSQVHFFPHPCWWKKDIAGCPVCATCLVMCSNTRKAQNKNTIFLESGKWVGVASCQHARLRWSQLDKSFVSAEGWNVSLCCGFEVQINVRCEALTRRCERTDAGGGGGGRAEGFKWCRLLPPCWPLAALSAWD